MSMKRALVVPQQLSIVVCFGSHCEFPRNAYHLTPGNALAQSWCKTDMTSHLITRRQFVKSAGAFAGSAGAAALTGCAGIPGRTRKKIDIRIEDISFDYDEHVFRAPVGFAGAVVDRATMITVRCDVTTAGGRVARGFGSMPFNHTFSFPSQKLTKETKNDAMNALAAELARATGSHREFGHPLEIN